MMKKKIVLGMGMLILLASLTSCGKTGEGKEPNVASNSTTSDIEKSKEEGSQEKKEVKKEDNEYSALAEKYAEKLTFEYIENNYNYSIMMMPARHGTRGYGYRSYESVGGELNPGASGELFATQYSGDIGAEDHLELCDISKYKDSTDIFELLVPLLGAEAISGGDITDYTYETLETKEINGFEMTKFKGEITLHFRAVDMDATFPFVAYGVKGTKTPVLICFYDRTEDQSSIDEWMEKIDYVASTYKELD